MVDEVRGPSKHLCLVSREAFPSGAFIAALEMALSPGEELEIIVDRRYGGSATGRPSLERRSQAHLARALARDGFVIVPKRGAAPAHHRIAVASPIERPHRRDADELELKQVVDYRRLRKSRRAREVQYGLIAGIVVTVLLLPAAKSFMSSDRAVAPPSVDGIPLSPKPDVPTIGLLPTVTEPSAPEPGQITASPTASVAGSETRPTAAIRLTRPRAAAARASAPPGTERQAQQRSTQSPSNLGDQPSNEADDSRAVVDWLFHR